MEVKPIRSDNDYKRALGRVEVLWGSPAGSSQGDELEVLVTLIEAYERENCPIDLPNPVEAIKFRLEQSAKILARWLGSLGRGRGFTK